jgi:hypothetical protein
MLRSMTRLGTIVATAVVFILAGPTGSASAGTMGAFKTPSRNVVCVYAYGYKGQRPYVECGIKSGIRPAAKPADCSGLGGDPANNTFVDLGSTGKSRRVRCKGDPGPFVLESKAKVLAYGRTWKHSGLRCRSTTKGLTCRNQRKHGFFLSRAHSRFF